MGTYEKLERLVNSKDLLKFGDYLVEFAESAPNEDASQAFLEKLYERSAQRFRDSTVAAYWENKPYVILEKGAAVSSYCSLVLPPPTNSAETLNSIQKVGLEHRQLYTQPLGISLSKNRLVKILKYLDKQHGFSDMVFKPVPPLFLLLDYSHSARGSELIINECEGTHSFYFLLYHLPESHIGETNPEAVFFHELGHAVHAKFTGNNNVAQAEILEFLNKNGFWEIEKASPDEVREIIADVLAIGMMFDSPYEKYISPKYHRISNDHMLAFHHLFQVMLHRNHITLKATA